MEKKRAIKTGNSGAEEQFVQLFCEVFGAEQGEYVYMQFPFLDIYGKHRTIDYAFCCSKGRIAVEIDGMTWHNPSKVSEDKYEDDLLKQNSMVNEGWKVFRWTDRQVLRTPDRVKDELVTFFGYAPKLFLMEDGMPLQQGEVFVLKDHQREALENLAKMRKENKTIAMLYEATGTGKTVTAVKDAKEVGERTLFLAHTKELLYQATAQFDRLWPEVPVGEFFENHRDTEQFIICASVQLLSRNLEAFSPDDFGYIIVDECHHAAAQSYQRVLSYFKPYFTLGLTATPERADGEDLLDTFVNVAHKLDIKSAVEIGALAPVRCIRIKTNIDMRDVRINGFRYNALDLESKIRVPDRNQLIVDTWLEYVQNKPTVVFCTSVSHAEEVAQRFCTCGIEARSVSGRTNPEKRKEILRDYENGRIPVLCACDLLNEGWDSPHTQILFMARPTMSRTIYMQQLGRGMRLCKGKDFLMVFDFVDNANLFNQPYSLHRLVGQNTYSPGALVLGTKRGMKWDQEMFKKGEKPDVLVDFPVNATDYEVVDLFNWQDEAAKMISQMEFVRRVNV